MASREAALMREQYVAMGARMAAEVTSIDDTRRIYDEWLVEHAPAPAALEATVVEYAGIRCVAYAMPRSSADRTVLYLHGGGHMIGSPDAYAAIAATLSELGDARVVAVDYRLAPEHAYPAGLDDAHAAYRALAAERGAEDIVLCGDSAGGGLVLSLLVALRDAGEPLPAGAVALSPWTDLTLSGESMITNAGLDPVISAAALGGMAAAYLQGQDPLAASPLFADLDGLPPLLLIAGGDEALRDDATRFADRARAAGVDIRLDVVDGLFHAFPITPDAFPEAGEACERVGAFVRASVGHGRPRVEGLGRIGA